MAFVAARAQDEGDNVAYILALGARLGQNHEFLQPFVHNCQQYLQQVDVTDVEWPFLRACRVKFHLEQKLYFSFFVFEHNSDFVLLQRDRHLIFLMGSEQVWSD